MLFEGTVVNQITKVALGKLKDGDTGSSILGLLAASLLSSGINFGDLVSSDHTKQGTAIGLTIGTIITLIWGWKIGKPKDTGRN